MTHRTVVGWNRTESADMAAEWAAARAEESGDDLLLVRVLPQGEQQQSASSDDEDAEAAPEVSAAAEQLEEARAELHRKHPGLRVDAEIAEGEPAAVLSGFSTPDTLLVVGTGTRDGVPYRFGWSVGALLAADVQGPLAIIPLERVNEGSQVVVGVNGSVASMRALEFAAEEAERMGRGLRLVYAWIAPPVTLQGYHVNPEYLDWLRESHEAVLAQALGQVRADHPRVTTISTLENDSAARALLAHSEEAALMVVGSRRSGPIRRALLGAASHSLILRMRCPLVVVGEPREASVPVGA